MKTESWKDIAEYEGLYQISDFGRVKSVSRTIIHSHSGTQFWKERILKQRKNRGYSIVNLCKGCKKFTAKVHRLVATAYLDNADNLPEVNHLDGDKSNNLKTNLEWISRSGNAKHAFKTGLSVSPNKNGQIINTKKLDHKNISVIKDLYSTGLFSNGMLANMFSVSKFLIWNVISGRKKLKNAA